MRFSEHLWEFCVGGRIATTIILCERRFLDGSGEIGLIHKPPDFCTVVRQVIYPIMPNNRSPVHFFLSTTARPRGWQRSAADLPVLLQPFVKTNLRWLSEHGPIVFIL